MSAQTIIETQDLTKVNVEVGLKDLVNAQITSGIQPGDVVSTASSGQ